MGWLSSFGINLTNTIIFWLEALPYQLTSGVSLYFFELLLLYAFLVFLLMLFDLRRFRYMTLAVICLFGLTFSRAFRYQSNSKQALIGSYHLGKISNFCVLNGNKAYIFADTLITKDKKIINFSVINHLYRQSITEYDFKKWETNLDNTLPFKYKKHEKFAVLVYKKKSVLILYQKLAKKDLNILENLSVDYCILQGRALQTLEQIAQIIDCKMIVLGASNGVVLNKKLAIEANKLRLKCHDVQKKGAFWIDL